MVGSERMYNVYGSGVRGQGKRKEEGERRRGRERKKEEKTRDREKNKEKKERLGSLSD